MLILSNRIPGEDTKLESLELARQIVDIVVEKMGSDVVLMEIGKFSNIADYFVICSGETDRQLDAIVREVRAQLKKEGLQPAGIEGKPSSGWVLLDCGDVVVHVFSPPRRDFYRLERLWSDAKTILRVA